MDHSQSWHSIVSRPILADADWTMGKVMDLMVAENISTALIVDSQGRMTGLLTESALLAAAVSLPLQGEPVSLNMQRRFVSVDEHDSLDTIIETFLKNKVRHLPVLRKGAPVGMVSRHGLLRALALGQLSASASDTVRDEPVFEPDV